MLFFTDEQRAEEELQKVQESYCMELKKLKMLRCKAEAYENEIEQQNQELERLMLDIEAEKQKCLDDTETLQKLKKELQEQNSKIDRANREIQFLLKEIKQKAISADFLSLFERDLNLQELENRNRKVLNLLCDMTNSDQDGAEIIAYMLDKGIKLPQHLKPARSRVSSRTTSYSSLDCYSVKGMWPVVTMKRLTVLSSLNRLQRTLLRLRVELGQGGAQLGAH